MSDVHKKGLDAELVREDLECCCLKDTFCQRCGGAACGVGWGGRGWGTACTIGFAKQCINNYIEKPQKEVPGGADNVPVVDFKAFDEVELGKAIVHILKECKDCKENHTEDCIINVIRNCYEVALFGDVHPYEGSAFQYLMYLKSQFPEKSALIAELYMS